ncbi:MAG TPA: flavodoxin domain-containing protein [Pilimelia sp.]|nr:flavodoxin domain-containing protein [Pilimelia sp.]
MRALVVYESMFGNTQTIAEAVAEGLAAHISVVTAEVGAAPPTLADGVELLVVGGPTHAFGLSRPNTRKSAVDQAKRPVVSTGIGLREWLDTLQRRSSGVAAVAFDTKVSKPRLPGSAARAATRRLRRLGFAIAAPAETFYVAGTPGPLLPGEAERARRWADVLGSRLSVATS